MKVALTGATGFIGRYIAREFMTPGDSLRAMVRPTSDTAFLEEGGAELLVGDFGNDDALRIGFPEHPELSVVQEPSLVALPDRRGPPDRHPPR